MPVDPFSEHDGDCMEACPLGTLAHDGHDLWTGVATLR